MKQFWHFPLSYISLIRIISSSIEGFSFQNSMLHPDVHTVGSNMENIWKGVGGTQGEVGDYVLCWRWDLFAGLRQTLALRHRLERILGIIQIFQQRTQILCKITSFSWVNSELSNADVWLDLNKCEINLLPSSAICSALAASLINVCDVSGSLDFERKQNKIQDDDAKSTYK